MRTILVCLLGVLVSTCEPCAAANPKFGVKGKPAAAAVDYSAGLVRGILPREDALCWHKGAVVFDRSHCLVIGHSNPAVGHTLYVEVAGVRYYRKIVAAERVVVGSISEQSLKGDLVLCRMDEVWPEAVKVLGFPKIAKGPGAAGGVRALLPDGRLTGRSFMDMGTRGQRFAGWPDAKNAAWGYLQGGDGKKNPYLEPGSSGCAFITARGELALMVTSGDVMWPKGYGKLTGTPILGGMGADFSSKAVQDAVAAARVKSGG